MSANANEGTNSDTPEDAMTVLSIPIDIVDQVLEFAEGLQSEDNDVSGYMISRGLSGVGSPPMANSNPTHTGITTFSTGADGTDLKWSDTDTVTYPG